MLRRALLSFLLVLVMLVVILLLIPRTRPELLGQATEVHATVTAVHASPDRCRDGPIYRTQLRWPWGSGYLKRCNRRDRVGDRLTVWTVPGRREVGADGSPLTIWAVLVGAALVISLAGEIPRWRRRRALGVGARG